MKRFTCDKCVHAIYSEKTADEPDHWNCGRFPPGIVYVNFAIMPVGRIMQGGPVPEGFMAQLKKIDWTYPVIAATTEACGEFDPKKEVVQ